MKATYFQRGESLDYKNEGDSAVKSNDVIDLTYRIAVAGDDIQSGSTGTIHVTGVYEMKKTGNAEIAIGQPVFFDGSGITDEADNGEAGESKIEYTPAGYATCKASAAATTIQVKIG